MREGEEFELLCVGILLINAAVSFSIEGGHAVYIATLLSVTIITKYRKVIKRARNNNWSLAILVQNLKLSVQQ